MLSEGLLKRLRIIDNNQAFQHGFYIETPRCSVRRRGIADNARLTHLLTA
jgi:hypothetical protein